MKTYLKTFLCLSLCQVWLIPSYGQKKIYDKAVVNQEGRMVFQQWDKNKFDPTPGFLYTNPYYWLVWPWHSGYKDHDLRPLGPVGPQTQRLALVAALQNTDDAYKLQTDTLRNSALADIANVSGLVTDADPLWFLYYSGQLDEVENHNKASIMYGIGSQVLENVIQNGMLDWYAQRLDMLKERLDGLRNATIDRGERIMGYYRMLEEYNKLHSIWLHALATARPNKKIISTVNKLRNSTTLDQPQRTDAEITRDVMSKYKPLKQ
ncbi:hypothetical protein [Mucilaginibacter lappiensis]|uniref:Uncharacterized protein n=1 Tax=Mucilaginibacter lappiensis TaxID=354630 RepID=A0A841JUK5_9SPHI|nr:hypothetical protein [Mucilaginibacter lappiensis]MBB6131511.1 hypothetical protein [Mucilaginibacter lappiensis]